ncbi:MAG: hypothetical protein IJ220_00520 [Clostridia bacterium]|nr:hypothetical protein [Clostridia bacterium]
MNIIFADARSHDNGIDFIVRNKNVIIRAMRKQNGEVVIMKDEKIALNTIPLSIKEKIEIFIGAVFIFFDL